MGEEECEYREATTVIEAFFDCARYNDCGDVEALKTYLSASPFLVEARDEQGRTAAHLAAANGHINILEALMLFGCSCDVPNKEGNTALHFAAINNQVDTARLLLQRGWSVSARNAFGLTPAQLICGKKYEAMEALLLEYDEEVDEYAGRAFAHTDGDVEEESEEAEGLLTPGKAASCTGVGGNIKDSLVFTSGDVPPSLPLPRQAQKSDNPATFIGSVDVNLIE